MGVGTFTRIMRGDGGEGADTPEVQPFSFEELLSLLGGLQSQQSMRCAI